MSKKNKFGFFTYFKFSNNKKKYIGLKAYTLVYKQNFDLILFQQKRSKNRYYFKYDLYSIQPVVDKRVENSRWFEGKKIKIKTIESYKNCYRMKQMIYKY